MNESGFKDNLTNTGFSGLVNLPGVRETKVPFKKNGTTFTIYLLSTFLNRFSV